MKKRIISAISLCLAAVLFISTGQLNAQYKFREFNSDREKFERYSDSAEKSITEQDWQNILDSGKQVMQADWERSAAAEMERYIRQGGDLNEVRSDMEEARAEWEGEYEKAEAYAKGSWFVKRENLVFESIDFTSLKKSVKDAGNDSSLNSVESWDSYISSSLAGVNQSWDIKFIPFINNIKSRGELLTGDVKTAFDAELAEFENELNRKFEIERNTIIYTGRNAFITEFYIDNESLKYQSARESADASTGNIIKEVQENLKSEEEKILTKSYNSEGVSSIDLSGMGDNWEEELKQLVNTGMEKWNGALDRLYQQMLTWKQDANDAYETAEALWRKAAEKLEQAKLEWEIKLSREIYEALDNWQKEERDLYSNIETARKDFTGYLNNLSSQWNDHSSGLIDMAVNGSKVYTEALDNIKWLEKMSLECEQSGQGAFGRRGEVKYEDAEFYSILGTVDRDNIGGTISSLPKSFVYNGIDYGFLFPIEGSTYYTGGYYTYEYAGATEKQDSDSNWYMTESYTIRVYGKQKRYTAVPDYNIFWSNSSTDYYWAESDVLVKTFTVTNDVTKDSLANEKSSYYYYKTELERWKKIRDSFAGIAAEAEAYMHEKNMHGEQGGPGYLHNAGGSDPYLMTDAEFALQIASRDKNFWQKRLDIAKAVLDYAEKTKSESAGTTEANKITAENRMKESKALYEKTLGEVDAIVAKLKILQGQKPSGARGGSNEAEWLAYLGSVEYLTAEYTRANNLLREADKDYTSIKTSLILIENGEDTDYLIKEIHQIEKNILQADRELYNTQIELFRKQLESEYSGRTAGFAGNYEIAVKNYEVSKFQFNTLQNILTGEESDTALIAWGNAIISAKDLLWGDNSGQYSSVISNLITGYTPAKREILSSAIRNIYFNFQFNMESAELIITKLRDSTFHPDEFIEKESGIDHAVYKKYADTSVRALEIIEEAMNISGNKTYDTIIEWLKTEFEKEKYIYGADNSRYIEHYTALKYFEERYKGLTAETWGSSRVRLESEIEAAVKASELHNDFNTLDADEIASMVTDFEMQASLGNMDAVAALREYYLSGSGIAGLGYIDDFYKDAKKSYNLNESLKAYVSENYRYFQKGQNLLVSHTYLNDMMGYINSVVSLASGSGESLLTAEDFKTLTPESLSIAAGAVKDFIRKLDTDKIPIPDFLLTAADLILEVKERLDTGLFIRRYMTNDSSAEMAGSVEDVYSRKLKESEELKIVTDFIDYCGDIIEAGVGDDYTLALNILSEYETLNEDNKEYLKNHKDEKIKAAGQFIADLYLYRYTINLNNLALQYADTEFSVTPEQFAADKGLDDTGKDKLITIIRPVYERRIYDNGYKDGNIKDINGYIADRVSSGKINSEDGEKLKAYALINEYLHYSSGDDLTSTDPSFSEYIKYKKFENYILSVTRDTGDSDKQYAEKCAGAYHGVNGGDIEDLTDFAESFIEGDLSAFSYLAEDVKIYAASEYYYHEMFSKNKVPYEGIEKFLEDKFGEESINGAVIDAVRAYTGRLNTVSFYYGRDLDNYTAGLDSSARDYFLMYINGISEAILPGFEYGIYDKESAHGGLMVELGKLTAELDRYAAGFNELETQINKYNEIAAAGLKNALALKTFYASGEDGKNWRGDMLAIKEGDVLVTPVPVSDLSEWSDSYDSTSGLRNTVVYSAIPLTRDGKVFYLNGIIDDMNKISSMFNSLGEAMMQKYEPEAEPGIAAFLTEADKYYTSGNIYSYENSEFSFESLLRSAVSGYEALSENRISEVSVLTGTLNAMESNLANIKNTFASKKRSFNLIAGGKSRETLLAELEESRVEHEKAKREVEDFRKKLSDARGVYESENTAYVEKMNLVSETYSDYKRFEFEYEKAYSIWEYAKTPYIHDDKTDTGDIGSGQTPSGGSTYYGNIPVPDARDNYQRILAKYNQVMDVYNKKAEAVVNQDTIEKLNEDEEYAKLKADFIRKSESYIRASQVDTVLGEDLERFKIEYKLSKEEFNNAKESVKFYADAIKDLSDEQKIELGRKRDIILSHIAEYGENKYMNAMAWYSSYRVIVGGAVGDRYHANISEYMLYLNLPPVIKTDIETLNTHFGKTNTSLDSIFSNYQNYQYLARVTEEARNKWKSTSKFRYFKKRERKRTYEALKNDRDNSYSAYYWNGVDPIKTTITDYIKKRNDFIIKERNLNEIVSIKNLNDLKKYLDDKSKYGLTEEDLSHLHDSVSSGFEITNESICLDFLRKDQQRVDIDGEAVKVKFRDNKVIVLAKDGSELTGDENKYDIINPGIKLKIKGVEVTSFVNDGIYDLHDLNFNIKSVTEVLKNLAEKKREEYYNQLMKYVLKTSADGTHDYTVMLRDIESTFKELQDFASNFNFDVDDPEGEKRQRSFDGYVKITTGYANDGQGTSIQDLIVRAMMNQSRMLQEQLWEQQVDKFTERRKRWNEVTGYILNRGMAEWRENYSEFKNLWTKWKSDAKKMIAEGENWWSGVSAGMTQEMTLWSEETSKATSKEAAQQIYIELEGRISRYESDLKNKMPGNAEFEINTDQILSQAMKNRPVDSIGILTQTMKSTDTTAGFTNLLNLGLSGSLFKYNEKQMEEYTNAMGVMKNLQVIDILNGIIKNFNEQLEIQNGRVYDAIGRIATGEDIIGAPFQRKTNENQWSIRVCVESAIFRDKYKTRRFTDYSYFENSTVFLQPVKGLNGTMIDFTQLNTYKALDSKDLDTYVGLEVYRLQQEISKTFKNPEEDGTGGGHFSAHINSEQNRIVEKFKDYYKEWAEGEAMRGMAGWNKPIARGAPSIAVSINIGAQVTGAVAGGILGGYTGAKAGAVIGQFAAAAVTTGLDVADDQLTWQHAGAQIGSGFVTAGSGVFAPLVSGALRGIDYEDGGVVGWDNDMFKAGLRSGIKETGVRTAVGNIPGWSDMAASWVDTDGGWGDWGFNNGNWGDHIVAGIGGLAGSIGAPGQSAQLGTELVRFLANQATGGRGFEDRENLSEDSFNWNLFRGKASDIGALLPQVADSLFNVMPDGEGGSRQSDTSDPLQQAETMLGGWWQSIKEGYGEGGINGVIGAIAGAVTGYAGFVGAGIANGYDEAKKNWSIMNLIGGFGVIDTVIDAVKGGFNRLFDAVGGLFGEENNPDIQSTTDSAVNLQVKISEIEAIIKKIEKSNPEEAAWLREKVKMMQQGITVNELDKNDRVDVSNAVKGGSVQYYLLNEFMRRGDIDMGRAGEFDDIMKKYNDFVELNGREPNRFELLYDGDMSELTDPSLWKQNGPMKDVFVNTLNDLIDKYQSGDMNLNGDTKKLMEYMLAEIDKGNFGNLVKDTAGGICRAFTLWTISVGQGAYNGGFEDFYIENFEKGYIGSMNTKDEFKTSFVNNPSAILKDYGLSYNTIADLTGKVDKNGNSTYNSLSDEMLAKIPVGVDKAIAWIDTKGQSGRGRHYMNLERRGTNWYMMDHNDRFRWDQLMSQQYLNQSYIIYWSR